MSELDILKLLQACGEETELGDFTPDELSALCEIATPVTFGTSVLRAETAAIYGLSVLKSFALEICDGL